MSLENGINLSQLIINLEEQRNQLKKKCSDLEDTIQTRNEKISKLKLQVQYEKFKNSIMTQIISQKTDIKIEDTIVENDEGTHIYNFPNGNIPIFVHDNLQETKTYALITKKTSTVQPGKTFRTVKNLELIEEDPNEVELKIKEVEEKFEVIVQENNLEVSYKETINSIEANFTELGSNARFFKKNLNVIKELRSKLLAKINLNDYIKLVKTHILRLEGIFLKKKFDKKKMITTISSSLSPLEQRLCFYGQYYNSELEPDDIQKFQLCLKVNMNYPKRYVSFVTSEIPAKICNYSLAICSIKENIMRTLINPYDFSNVCYLQLEKSTLEDPYSFYSLEKIDKEGKRCWKMECRLDDFSKFLSEHIKTYCINLFRKIYFDIFNDNLFRKDYIDKAPVFQQDCEQLLLNIISVSKQKHFCNLLRDIIVKYCTIQPAQNDKFNFTKDDTIVKKTFLQEKDTDKDVILIIQRLFDEIKYEEAEHIFLTHCD
jgi:hypothetical protein